jgi:membrane fusion protein (multidrug efflux system)
MKQQLDIMMNAEGKTFQDKVNNMPPVNLVLSNGSLFEQKKEKFRHLAVSQ